MSSPMELRPLVRECSTAPAPGDAIRVLWKTTKTRSPRGTQRPSSCLETSGAYAPSSVASTCPSAASVFSGLRTLARRGHTPKARLHFAQGAVDVLGDRFDRERRVRVGHDGADGLDPRREAGRPVVRLAEDADQALLVDCALRLVQVLSGPLWVILIQGAALFLEHVAERGHRQVVVDAQALFAVRVELHPEVADRGPLRLGGCRDGDQSTVFEKPIGRPRPLRRLTRPLWPGRPPHPWPGAPDRVADRPLHGSRRSET